MTALINSGIFTSLINCHLVSVGPVDHRDTTDTVCVHGDHHVYPKTEITVYVDEQPYLLTVGVVDNLPVDLLLLVLIYLIYLGRVCGGC